jgi:hypothetical protein
MFIDRSSLFSFWLHSSCSFDDVGVDMSVDVGVGVDVDDGRDEDEDTEFDDRVDVDVDDESEKGNAAAIPQNGQASGG